MVMISIMDTIHYALQNRANFTGQSHLALLRANRCEMSLREIATTIRVLLTHLRRSDWNDYAMMPERKALATAWVRLTQSSFLQHEIR